MSGEPAKVAKAIEAKLALTLSNLREAHRQIQAVAALHSESCRAFSETLALAREMLGEDAVKRILAANDPSDALEVLRQAAELSTKEPS